MIAAKWITESIPEAQGKEKPLSAITDYKTALRFIRTGDVSQAQAMELAGALQRRGLVMAGISHAGQGNKNLIEFLLEYWDYNNSKALKQKRVHGKQVLKDTCYSAAVLVGVIFQLPSGSGFLVKKFLSWREIHRKKAIPKA